MDILKQIDGRCDVTTGLDVVFIHGAETDAEKCWHPPGHPEFSMLHMLARDLPYVCVWSVGYTSTLYRRKGYTLRLAEQATQTIRELANRSIGCRPLVFVAHSVGGLLIKHVLRLAAASDDPQWRKIVEQTKGIIFLSTPHFGFRKTNFWNWLARLPTINEALLADVLDLETLRALNDDFISIVARSRIAVEVYYEGKPSPRLLWLARIVSADSADPCIPGVQPTVVAADHDAICKPTSPDDHIQVAVRRFVRRCFAGPATDIFISYAHEDTGTMKLLSEAITTRLADASVQIWNDQAIATGASWETEIIRHMERSRVAVLLLSPSFLKSDFIVQTELPFLRRKADTEGMELIVVPLSQSDYQDLSFHYSMPEGGTRSYRLDEVQWASPPEQPVDSMTPQQRDAFYQRLASEIVALALPPALKK
jgi:hypothetical protein